MLDVVYNCTELNLVFHHAVYFFHSYMGICTSAWLLRSRDSCSQLVKPHKQITQKGLSKGKADATTVKWLCVYMIFSTLSVAQQQ